MCTIDLILSFFSLQKFSEQQLFWKAGGFGKPMSSPCDRLHDQQQPWDLIQSTCELMIGFITAYKVWTRD